MYAAVQTLNFMTEEKKTFTPNLSLVRNQSIKAFKEHFYLLHLAPRSSTMIVLCKKKKKKTLEHSHQMLQMHINFSGTSAALARCYLAERSPHAKLVSCCIITWSVRINPTLQTLLLPGYICKIKSEENIFSSWPCEAKEVKKQNNNNS